jgi:drug/metabolite transporter (DMT)-like permease|tara:strand:- start:829 stop:1734 length:906 start_codon:yes stop_codon:yes gene_type:complete
LNKLANQNKAYLLALLAIIFWSTMSSAFKLTLRYIEFDQLLLWSSLFGAIALLIINQFSKKRLNFKLVTVSQIKASAIMGFFNPFLYYLVLFKAYELLEAQIAGTLNYTWPIVLVIMSIFFLNQKISVWSIMAIFISFFGIVIISTQGSFISLENSSSIGILLAVGSAFFWAYYWILNMKDDREETGKIFLNLFFGFVYILVYLLFTTKLIIFPTGYALIGSIYIGLFEMSITFVIWLMALTNSSNTAKVSNLIYLSPFIALFFIRYTVGEKIHISTFIGLIFIVGGILIQQFLKNRINKS